MRKYQHLVDFIFTPIECASIKKDPERRAKTVKFGIKAIVMSLFMIAFAYGGAFLMTIVADSALGIFIVVIAVALLMCAAVLALDALLNMICQLILNRKAISFIALAVFIASLAATLALVLNL